MCLAAGEKSSIDAFLGTLQANNVFSVYVILPVLQRQQNSVLKNTPFVWIFNLTFTRKTSEHSWRPLYQSQVKDVYHAAISLLLV